MLSPIKVCCHSHSLQSLFHPLKRIDHTEKILKRNRPVIDPCGTSNSISSQELYDESIFNALFLWL